MFYVFLVKAFTNKHKFVDFHTEEELREYLHDYLTRHKKFSTYKAETAGIFCELEEIIREAIKVGFILQEEKRCYAVCRIFEGDDLFNREADESDTEFYTSVSSNSSVSSSLSESELRDSSDSSGELNDSSSEYTSESENMFDVCDNRSFDNRSFDNRSLNTKCNSI